MNLAALYVYWVIIGWIFITGVGLIPFVPEEVAVAGLGAWIHQNPDAFLPFSWLICVGAVMGTDLFLYMIGRLGGWRLLRNKYVQKILKPERVQTFSRKFQERGIWFMLTARLIPGWRSAVFITAGSIHYPLKRFVLADAISSVPLVTFFFFGGYFAADWVNEIIGNLHHAQNWLLLVGLAAALVVGLVIYLRWMRKHQEQEAAEEAQEHEKLEQQSPAAVVPAVKQPEPSRAAAESAVRTPVSSRP